MGSLLILCSSEVLHGLEAGTEEWGSGPDRAVAPLAFLERPLLHLFPKHPVCPGDWNCSPQTSSPASESHQSLVSPPVDYTPNSALFGRKSVWNSHLVPSLGEHPCSYCPPVTCAIDIAIPPSASQEFIADSPHSETQGSASIFTVPQENQRILEVQIQILFSPLTSSEDLTLQMINMATVAPLF